MNQINFKDITDTEFRVHAIRAHEATWQKKGEALGFYDEAHFRKMFQTVTGITPGVIPGDI